MTNAPNKPGWKSVVVHDFPGFYESVLNAMIDDELEQTFHYDNGSSTNMPDEIYGGNPELYARFDVVHEEMAKAYFEAWFQEFESATGIKMEYEYECYTSPKFYNFETDRLFGFISDLSLAALFAASEADKHVELGKVIKTRFSSRDGFISAYPNDLGDWLAKPINSWDHNEIGTLLDAVLLIHCTESDIERDFNTWSLMEDFQCNGYLSNAVWAGIPAKMREFIELQNDHKQALNFELWVETGKAYSEDTTREDLEAGGEVLPLPCPNTLNLFGGKNGN